MLDANWEYWEGPRFAAEMPIKWEIVDDPVVEGATVMSSFDPAAEGGLYGAADIVTKEKFMDFRLHVEFNITQEGGNSGVYLQNRYEIQILDGDSTTHALATMINETESPYYAYNGTGQWNAYDVLFRAARFEDGTLAENRAPRSISTGRRSTPTTRSSRSTAALTLALTVVMTTGVASPIRPVASSCRPRGTTCGIATYGFSRWNLRRRALIFSGSAGGIPPQGMALFKKGITKK